MPVWAAKRFSAFSAASGGRRNVRSMLSTSRTRAFEVANNKRPPNRARNRLFAEETARGVVELRSSKPCFIQSTA